MEFRSLRRIDTISAQLGTDARSRGWGSGAREERTCEANLAQDARALPELYSGSAELYFLSVYIEVVVISRMRLVKLSSP